MVDLPFDIERFEAIVREAGAIALRDFHLGDKASTKSWAKHGGSPVSDADLAIDNFLREQLGELMPDAGWLSEETADSQHRLDKRYVWIVDPIDGTRGFLKGLPGWCVSVALIEGDQPIAAALYAPKLDIFYSACLGGGATANGTALQVSNCRDLKGARKPTHRLQKREGDMVKVDCPNSIALRIAMVASGDADLICTYRWGSEWDIAAAFLIASEAGAIVSDAIGHPVHFNQPRPHLFGIMVAAPGIHKALCEHMVPELPEILRQADDEHKA